MTGQPTEIPQRRLEAHEVLAHDDLYAEVQTLGDGEEPRLVREGGISFGRLNVYTLFLDDFPDLVRRRPALETRAFALIEFPFDLDELTGPRRYTQARYRIELDTPGAIAGSLWPTLVTTAVDVEQSRTFGVQADLSFGALNGAPGAELTVGRTFRYTELRPLITTFGAGRSTFWWTFTAQEGQPLTPAGRRVFAIVDYPKGTPTLAGNLVGEVIVARKKLRLFEPTETRPCQRRFQLQFADGSVTLGELEERSR